MQLDMDFSSLLSKEISQKRKKVTRKRKLTPTKSEPLKITQQEINLQEIKLQEIKLQVEDELLDYKLSEFGEQDMTLSQSDKVRKLELLLLQEVKNNKYKAWLDQEAPLYRDPSKQAITMELITDIEHHSDEVCLILRVYIKELIKQWEETDNEDSEFLLETKKNLVKLLYKLRSHKLPQNLLISLLTIVYHIQQNEFNKANESYMKLSIGNVCWPIGVVNVGIHARNASLKITGATNVSNIMLNESTRRWIISIKRLISFKERIYTG